MLLITRIKSQLKARLRKWNLYKKFHSYGYIAPNAELSEGIVLSGENHIGSRTRLGNEVQLGKGVRLGDNCMIDHLIVDDYSEVESGVICMGNGPGKISIGKHCYIGMNNVLDWSAGITIGDYVHITGASSGIWTHTSAPMCQQSIRLSDVNTENRPIAPVHIENNVCIGGNCTIYPGVRIGHHAIVAPHSVVTKDVPPHTMVAGVPADVVKQLPIPPEMAS